MLGVGHDNSAAEVPATDSSATRDGTCFAFIYLLILIFLGGGEFKDPFYIYSRKIIPLFGVIYSK